MNASTAPSPMAPSHLPALDNTLGAGLIGAFDPLYLKLWVLVVLILEVFDTALAMHITYTYMVTEYFNPMALGLKPLWSFTSIPIPGSLSAVIVELFFARRLWLVGPRFRVVAIVTRWLSRDTKPQTFQNTWITR
ncbi:hypothetical protein C8Q74DRAFT_971064 [Fomes fomentarius]|nr:hypothetical protein C8Q74DRAFT_971064 [Fomes fomentarius]